MMRRIALMLVALMAMVLPFSCTPSANADTVDGCGSFNAKQKVSSWGKQVKFSANPQLDFPDVEFRLASWARYWHCPAVNGNAAKTKVTHVSFCATKYDGRDPQTLQGFKYNTYFFTVDADNDKFVDPPTRMLEWNGVGDLGDQRCTGASIPEADRTWMGVPQGPAWSLEGWVALTQWPDQNYTFKDPETGEAYRELKPGIDANYDPLI